MSKRTDFVRKNSKNYLYVFIPSQDINQFPAAVRNKRSEQIRSLAYIAGNEDINDLVTEMNNQLLAEFGMSGLQMVVRLCQGYNVYGKAALGSTSETVEPVEVNPDTGFPITFVPNSIGTVGSDFKLDSDVNWNLHQDKPMTIEGYMDGQLATYTTIFDQETKTPIGLYSVDTGKQVSSYNTNTKKFENTPTTGKNTTNFWVWILEAMPFIISLLEWIGSLFGIKKSKDISALQSDGWYSPSTNGSTATGQASFLNSTTLALVIGGAVLYGLFSSDSKAKKGNKRK